MGRKGNALRSLTASSWCRGQKAYLLHRGCFGNVVVIDVMLPPAWEKPKYQLWRHRCATTWSLVEILHMEIKSGSRSYGNEQNSIRCIGSGSLAEMKRLADALAVDPISA